MLLVRMVVGGGMRMALLDVALGLAGALAATRVLASLVYGVSTTDPLTMAATAACPLLGAAALASLVPAMRAARVDPAVLRAEYSGAYAALSARSRSALVVSADGAAGSTDPRAVAMRQLLDVSLPARRARCSSERVSPGRALTGRREGRHSRSVTPWLQSSRRAARIGTGLGDDPTEITAPRRGRRLTSHPDGVRDTQVPQLPALAQPMDHLAPERLETALFSRAGEVAAARIGGEIRQPERLLDVPDSGLTHPRSRRSRTAASRFSQTSRRAP